ncbi:MAG TPA: 16S rRNA (cytosine(1402)-N(4))-methyltransferase RsmH [Dehalococcoidia bacterium]|nr:16S rRNA (cytosine(1402)-N(4))-methyltransferase RsmH [Dehalococcoidia bacterium]
MDQEPLHQPVMVAESLDALSVRPGGVYLDATLGEGGHSLAILEASNPTGRVLGLDLDPRSRDAAALRLESFGQRFVSAAGNYGDMVALAHSLGLNQVDGILMDLGFSSRQIGLPGYGLSFLNDEPLDMRYDPEALLTASDVVNNYSEQELARVIYEFGEETRSRQIARRIVGSRPVRSTTQLASLVASASGPRRGGRTHPATRTFQAIRIEVNDELVNLASGLEGALQLLNPSGRLAVISYHSLEDRVVKLFMQRQSALCICPPEVPICVCGHQPTLKLVHRRVIKPSAREIQENLRSRSAKLRVAYQL